MDCPTQYARPRGALENTMTLILDRRDLKPLPGSTLRDPRFSFHKSLPGYPQVDEVPCATVEEAVERGKVALRDIQDQRTYSPGFMGCIDGVLLEGGKYFAVLSTYHSNS